MYPNFRYLPSVTSVAELCVTVLRMIVIAMLRLTHLPTPARKRFCTAIVLVAVCALTVSVATRYGSTVSDATTTVVQKHTSWEPSLQRLLNNAATWVPPVVESAVLQTPRYSPDVIPSGPKTFSNVLLESDLFNRPPPSCIAFFS